MERGLQDSKEVVICVKEAVREWLRDCNCIGPFLILQTPIFFIFTFGQNKQPLQGVSQ